MANRKQQTARRRRLNVLFPLLGLDRRASYRQQKPYSTPDAINIRPHGPVKGRERGGSRPGLVLSHIDDLGSNVRLLSPMILNLGDGFTTFSDTFSGPSLATVWTQASWADNVPNILPEALVYVDTTIAEGEVVLDSLPIDSTKAYTVELFIVPWGGEHHGNYRLYLRLTDEATVDLGDGIIVDLDMTGTDGSYDCTLTSIVTGVSTDHPIAAGTLTSGAAEAGWLTILVSGNNISIFWAGKTLIATEAVGAHTGLRMGFGMECTTENGVCLANTFRCQYYSTGTVDNLRTKLIASCGGTLWQESTYGRMTAVANDLTFRDDVLLTATQSGQKLYIADYGDVRDSGTDGQVVGTDLDDDAGQDWTTLGIDVDSDVVVISDGLGTAVNGTYKIDSFDAASLTLASAAGTGACSYRIERAPKIYDPDTDTTSIYFATAGKGQVPTGNPLICRHLDRIFLGGAEIAPHVWYAARQSDELDFDYSQTDAQRAVAGTTIGGVGGAGVPGKALTAFIPHSADILIMAGRDSLNRLRGDPAYGGSLDALSHTIGVIGRNAWCQGPAGEIIFLSLDGLYILPAGTGSFPISMSREVLPQEFLNLDPDSLTVSLEYDVQGRGVHIYLTSDASNARYHWWFEWETKTFWPMSITVGHEPMATCTYQSAVIEDSGVILGGRDGMLRRMSELAERDCGTAYTTYVLIGPIALAADAQVGTVVSMDCVIAEGSGDVTWELRPSLTFEAAVAADASDTGTWAAGINGTSYPAAHGQAVALKLTGTSGRKWALEGITATVRAAGRRRLA